MNWIESFFSINEGLNIWITAIFFFGNAYFYFSDRQPRWELMFLISALYILISRFFDFEYWWSNPDTAQWVICAKSIVDTPKDWLFDYSLFDFTRILTILPLILVYWIKGEISQLDLQIIFMFFLIFIIFIQYRLMWFVFKSKAVFMALSLFCMFFVMSKHGDFRVYNSELPSVLLLSIVAWLFIAVRKRKMVWLTIGFILSIVPFAKDQAAFIAIGLFMFILLKLLFEKQYSELVFLVFGSLFGGFLWILFIMNLHGWDKLHWFLSVLYDYSNNGMNAHYMPPMKKLKIFVKMAVINREMSILFPLMCLSVALVLKQGLFFKSKSEGLSVVYQFYLLLFLITIYTLYSPGNGPLHYVIFLWPVIIFYLTFLFSVFIQRRRIVNLIWLIPVFIFFLIDFKKGTTKIFRDEGYTQRVRNEWMKQEEVKELMKNNAQNKSMLVWGWDNIIPVELNCIRVSGYLYPQFAFGHYSSAGSVRSYYLEVMSNRKPDFFLELVGEGRFFFNDRTLFGVTEVFPELNKILTNQYTLLSKSANYKIYKRN